MFSLDDARRAAGFSSNGKLAAEVLRRWKASDARATRPAPTSLATKIGELEKNPVWWRKRPKAAEALAAALQVALADLPLAGGRGREETVWLFEDLPELPPLNLAVEQPCRSITPDWWSLDALSSWAQPRAWIQAPPGAGKTLLARWYRVRGLFRTMEVPRLEDVLGKLDDKGPILFDVQMPDPATDARASDALLLRNGVIIVAGFPVPVGPVASARAVTVYREHLKRSEAKELEPNKIAEVAAALLWHRVPWAPKQGWRRHFVEWVVERRGIRDASPVEAIAKWFESNDPGEILIPTPGDALPFLSYAFLGGELDQLQLGEFVQRWLRQRVRRASGDGTARASWLASTGERAMMALLRGKVADVGRAWETPLTISELSAFLPAQLAVRDAAATGLGRALQELAHLPKLETRANEAKRIATEANKTSARVAVQHLIDARLLRTTGEDRYQFPAPWLGTFFAIEEVPRALKELSASSWGQWAAEPSRRGFVDAALDHLPHHEIEAQVEDALKHFDRKLLGCAGAIEALFSAVARRLEQPDFHFPRKRLHALWGAQRSLLVPKFSDSPGEPLTRAGVHDRPGRAHWIADAWAFSVHVPPPNETLSAELSWILPGWAQIRLSDMPGWLSSLLHERDLDSALVLRLRRLVDALWPRCSDTEFPAKLSYPPFGVDLLLLAQDRGWDIPPEHALHVLVSQGDASELKRRLPELSTVQRTALVEKIWWKSNAAPGASGWLVQRLARESPDGLDVLARWLPLSEVTRAAKEKLIPVEALEDPSPWPLHFWKAAVHGIIERADDDLRRLFGWSTTDKWGPETGEVVELFVEHDHSGYQAARLLWRVSPDRALVHARAAFEAGSRAEQWFFEGAECRPAELLDIIARAPTPMPDWVSMWLARQLTITRPDADRVYALLYRCLLELQE